MTMAELYEEMKAALKHFGLHFSDMDQVTVTMSEGAVSFHHDNMIITIKVKS